MNATTGPRSWIRKKLRPGGEEACIRDTNINVWGLVEYRRLGLDDAEILCRVVGLTQADLDTAWDYYAAHPTEVERELWLNRVDLTDYGGPVPVWVLVQGRRLGLSDAEIRDAFDPPLAQATLDAAWAEYARRPDDIERALHVHAPHGA